MKRAYRARGYTVIELMLAMAALMLGISGTIAMQYVMATTTKDSRDIAVATRIAESWLDMLHTDSLAWNDLTDQGDTVWLGTVPNPADGQWIRPAWDGNTLMGPAFDALGRAVDPTTTAEQIAFCADIRLSWMVSSGAPIADTGILRAEVRVYWRRDSTPGFCAPTSAALSVTNNWSLYHFVNLSTAIRQHPPLPPT